MCLYNKSYCTYIYIYNNIIYIYIMYINTYIYIFIDIRYAYNTHCCELPTSPSEVKALLQDQLRREKPLAEAQ